MQVCEKWHCKYYTTKKRITALLNIGSRMVFVRLMQGKRRKWMETCSLQKAIETLKKEGYGYRVSGDLLYFNKKGCYEIKVREEFGGGCVFTTNRWAYHDPYEAMTESKRRVNGSVR